jgi:HAD superfamily hydrolase (TIGR01509 family)
LPLLAQEDKLFAMYQISLHTAQAALVEGLVDLPLLTQADNLSAMRQIPLHTFQVALVDFDGTLIDTEPFHYRAVKEMLKENGHELQWDMAQYCAVAHAGHGLFTDQLFERFPFLLDRFGTPADARARKNEIYQELIESERSELIPGAERLLESLDENGLKIVIVTNSLRCQIEVLASHHSIFEKVAGWVVKDDYTHRKPHPESYQLAMSLYCQPGDRTIGFEDTAKGVTALQAAGVDQAVWILSPDNRDDRSFLNPSTLLIRRILDLYEEEAVSWSSHGRNSAVLGR